jgi:hypothetical protein
MAKNAVLQKIIVHSSYSWQGTGAAAYAGPNAEDKGKKSIFSKEAQKTFVLSGG